MDIKTGEPTIQKEQMGVGESESVSMTGEFDFNSEMQIGKNDPNVLFDGSATLIISEVLMRIRRAKGFSE